MSRVYEELDPAYAAACSDVTLYSKSKGFFCAIAEEAVAIASVDEWLAYFEKVDDTNKVSAVMANKEVSIEGLSGSITFVYMYPTSIEHGTYFKGTFY